MKKYKHVGRIDGVAGHGWYFRMSIKGSRNTFKGKKLSKFFADAANGGKNKALAMALDYRQSVLMSLPVNVRKKAERPHRVIEDSGVTHITYRLEESKGPGRKDYEYWCVHFKGDDGIRRARSFSWNKFGKFKAFSMALKLVRRTYGDRTFQKELIKGGGFYKTWTANMYNLAQ